MENNQNPSQNDNAKKPDRGGLIIIGIIAVVIIVIIIYFEVQGSDSGGGRAVQPPEDMGELLELNDLNIHGSWFRDEADGSSYEIRFSADNVLHFYMYDAEGNTVAESDEGTYETKNDKLYLSIMSKGEIFSDVCTAAVSINVLFISADEGTGLFNGTYYSEYQAPDYLLGDDSETDGKNNYRTEASATGMTTGITTEAAVTTTEPITATAAETTATTTEATTTTAPITTTTAATTTTTTTVVTEPTTTEPPVTEPPVQEEYHLPEAVINSFDLTIEEFYANLGYVPLCEDYEDLTDYVDLIQPGSLQMFEENKYKFKLAFYPGTTASGATIRLGFDGDELWNGDVVGVGKTMMVKCNPSFLFPGMHDITYYDLLEKFGDKLVAELENTNKYMTTPYLIHVDIDGYRVFFDKCFSLERMILTNAYVFPLP